MAQPLSPEEARSEARTTAFLFVFAFAVVAAAVIGAALWGLVALTVLALGATVLVYAMLAAYAAGL
ncbi:hypothetical protein [Paracoccus sp. (in: a-proteobacteria)]|uniref:hypothetical protein n=1 Tax=Paracoccus sp. TaxID=267 RepID=UPI00321F7E75